MKTLIKKEIRLLLPAWITAMLLAIVPRLFVVICTPNYALPLSFFADLIVAAGLLFLGINSFGQELSCNTFSALLSQPMKRPRIWRIKVATLATAFISVWLTAILFALWQFGVHHDYPVYERPALSGDLEFLTLSALVAFSGGLWTTLLLRQIAGAFWFTVLTPLAIILGISAVFQDWIAWGKSIEAFIVVGLVLYSVAGFILAWKLFMRAQDVLWTGVEVSLPRGGRVSKIKARSLSFRPGHRFSALAWKEFQLHQGTYLIAAIVLVLHLTAWCIRKFHPPVLNPDLAFAFNGFWILWLLMPLLIGATAIAEERRMGTLEPQLCLPSSRGAQLVVKFCVALVLSLVFGALMPVLIEGTKTLDQWPWIFAIAGAIFYISFYASSLGRTTLQGIGLAILVTLVIYLYQIGTGPAAWARPRTEYYLNQWLGIELLKWYLGVPLFLIALAWLTFSNFRHVNQNWKFWARNIAIIVAVFVCAPLLARAIYFRPWELVLPLETRGPVRITNPDQVKFAATRDGICAMLPDGRLWVGPIIDKQVSIDSESFTGLVLDHCRGQFIGGSNWVDVAADGFETIGIQSDGTLWAIPTEWSAVQAPSGPVTMTQIGGDDDWSRVASEQNGFLLLKKDGSLWAWGTQRGWSRQGDGTLAKKLRRDLASMPVRVSDETNWTEVDSEGSIAYAKDKDGRYWRLADNHMIQEILVDDQWSSLQFDQDLSYVEVKTNGQLWFFNRYPRVAVQENLPKSRRFQVFEQPGKKQLGAPRKWRTATFGWVNGIRSIMAIRSDGTLWQFPISWSSRHEYQFEKPVQIGGRSDWIALGQGFALAADGSVWVRDEQPSDHAWLAPSRKPNRLGNIFEGEEANQP